MARKLDMGKAWNHAIAMLSGNLSVVLVVAGVFFFLPSLASSLLVPVPEGLAEMQQGAQPDPAIMMRILSDWLSENWWVFALSTLLQTIGVLGLISLLTDRSRPTVGEALAFGVKALPTYIGTQLITLAGFGAAMLLVAVVGGASEAVAAVLVLMLSVAVVYAGVKLALVSPVIGVEKQMNPLAVITRSWTLTKGNSLLIFVFILLLAAAFMVISIVTGLAMAAFSIIGEEVGKIAEAIGGAALSMVLVTVFVAVLAAIHFQLSGGETGQTSEAFE